MSRITVSLGVAVLAFVAIACGSTKSPTAPALVAPGPAPAPAVSTYSLTGSVMADTSSGSLPADGAHIEVIFGDSGDLQAVASADGHYSVAGISAGQATIRVNKDGFVPEERQVQMSGDLTLDFNLKSNQ
jgi:hypothetical protein